jgi:hypothetical protein
LFPYLKFRNKVPPHCSSPLLMAGCLFLLITSLQQS